MLDYTQAAWRQIVKRFKKVSYIFSVVLEAFYLLYHVYAVIFEAELWFVNAPLLVCSVLYFGFFLFLTKFGKAPEEKHVKIAKVAHKWIKRALRLVTIGLSVYEICTANPPDLLVVLFTGIMILGWAMQILLDVLIKIVNAQFEILKQGLEMDIDELTKPVRQAGNFFKKITGREVEPEKTPSERQLLLKEQAEEYKAEQKQKKKDRHEEWKKEQAIAKAERKKERSDLKKSAKAERALLRATKKQKKQTGEQTDEQTGERTNSQRGA